MSDKGLYKTGLVCAVLTALSWAAFVYGMIASPKDPIETLADFMAFAGSGGALAYLWGGIFGSLLVIPVFLAIYHGFRQEIGSLLVVPVSFGIVGAALLALGFMVDSGSSAYQYKLDLAASEGPNTEILIQAAQLAQNSIEMTWAMGSILAYGLAIVWMAVLLLRSDRVPGWLNWLGIVGGAAGFVWALRWIPIPAPQSAGIMLLMANIILGMVWLIGVARILTQPNEDARP